MKKEYLILLGVLVLSGGIAYLYFRKTSKDLEGTTPEDAAVLRTIRIV